MADCFTLPLKLSDKESVSRFILALTSLLSDLEAPGELIPIPGSVMENSVGKLRENLQNAVPIHYVTVYLYGMMFENFGYMSDIGQYCTNMYTGNMGK